MSCASFRSLCITMLFFSLRKLCVFRFFLHAATSRCWLRGKTLNNQSVTSLIKVRAHSAPCVRLSVSFWKEDIYRLKGKWLKPEALLARLSCGNTQISAVQAEGEKKPRLLLVWVPSHHFAPTTKAHLSFPFIPSSVVLKMFNPLKLLCP